MEAEIGEEQSGLEVRDLQGDAEFAGRRLHVRDAASQVEALRRLAHVFANSPEVILTELVQIAVALCGADSSGISLEDTSDTGAKVFRWVATGGRFSRYLNGTTPRFYSPCGTCLDRGKAQLFRVTKPYYDALGIEAEPVTDGMLIPWVAGEGRGTIWIVAHESRQAFDGEDYRIMQSLADFAAIAVRHQHHQKLLIKHATATVAAAVVNELAHLINNPLQSLTNTLYLAAQGGQDAHSFAEQASADLAKLSDLVRRLLALPEGVAASSAAS